MLNVENSTFLTVLFLIFFISVLSEQARAEDPKRIALVIGNSQYTHSAPLDNPVRDARLIASALQDAGFEVRMHLDANFKTMKRAIRDFSKDIRVWGKKSVGLFYFAGHGTQVSGKNFLIPVDANITSEADVEIETIDAQGLLSAMHHSKNELNIVILDACRNNPFKRGSRANVQGFARMDAPTGALIAYSTQPGNVALDGVGQQNSPYAKALAATMRKPGVMIEQVFKSVRNSVRNQTSGQQIPWEESSLFGDFYFNKQQPPVISNRRISADVTFWNSIKESEIASAFDSYLKTFPNGIFKDLAKFNMNKYQKREKVAATHEKRKEIAALTSTPQRSQTRHLRAPSANPDHCKQDYNDKVSTRYCVSSVLPPTRTLRYGVLSLLDDSNFTAWTEDVDGHGRGEWISAEFDNVRRISGFTIKNGYNKRRKLYYQNSRVKSAKLIFSDGSSQSVRIKDKPGKQEVMLNEPVMAKWMQFKITAAYRGSKYKDNCVNEFRILSEATN